MEGLATLSFDYQTIGEWFGSATHVQQTNNYQQNPNQPTIKQQMKEQQQPPVEPQPTNWQFIQTKELTNKQTTATLSNQQHKQHFQWTKNY